ncbi:MAG: EAL domain-containing protein [Egibacteraceae bacterium]
MPAWSTYHLAEFLAAVSSAETPQAAIAVGVERIAESFDAEVCAYRSAEGVAAAVGFPPGRVPVAALLAAPDDDWSTLELPGLGACPGVSVPVGSDLGTSIVLVRIDEPITTEESTMLRGMARVLGLTLRTLGALDSERALRLQQELQAVENQRLLAGVRERQTLLERLSGVQHAILMQAPRQDVLDLITEGVAALLGDEMVGLRLVDPDDADVVTLEASHGLSPEQWRAVRRTSVEAGTGGQAIIQGRLIISTDYASDAAAIGQFVASGIVATMATPVRESGMVVGSLVVASSRAGRVFTARDEEILDAFAAHVSLALTDLRTREVMNRALDDAVHQALHDPLTGLPNRSLFVDRLTQALERARRQDTHAAVFFIDLDNFKLINDSSGHARGDELLRAVAARLADCVRTTDTVARFGGDEFAIVIEDVPDLAHAEETAQRLLEAFTDPLVLGGDPVTVGASIGVVVTRGQAHADELLLNADVAMYHAKTLGKGQWSVFRPEMHTVLLDGIELEATLRGAIERDQLHLVYQPIVELDGGATVGVEALLRWTHPTRGPIPPDEFIPLAEETGLIMEIGRWVLERACRDVRSWRVPGTGAPLALTVNVSARQMHDDTLVGHLRQVLQAHDFSASRLTLEVTESVFIDQAELAGQWLAELKGVGVRVALDDFGTGYSSLSYLQRFPIDVVKIDKSFVDGLASDAADAKLVEAIVNLSQALALMTVAEGVETDEQRCRLVELGCALGQGFYFARPMPVADIRRYLDGHQLERSGSPSR